MASRSWVVPALCALSLGSTPASAHSGRPGDDAPGPWTWVPVPGARCEDGTETGLGVSRGTSPDLLIYLDGGGACWDVASCVRDERYRHGPWGREEQAGRVARFGGSIFDRDEPRNPFRTFHHVFVPYCTADVHAGDRAAIYAGRTLQHRGYANVLAFAERIAAMFPDVRRVVVAGSSAGGYGSLVSYETLRPQWPNARGFLVDDSGPALRGVPEAAVRGAWWRAWGTPWARSGFCQGCTKDVARVWPSLSARWPGDRFALLSSVRDATMVGYLRTDPTTFERSLLNTVHQVLSRLPNVRTFLVPGDTHTMLGAPGRFDDLWGWLAAMVADDPRWNDFIDPAAAEGQRQPHSRAAP